MMADKTRRRRVSKVSLGNSRLTTRVVHFTSHIDTEQRKQRGTRIGYTRVSTVSQTLDQQNESLTAADVTKTFSDTMSGARDDRPGLAALMDYVRTG
jgi:predicted site-specific integrase-resolvase